MAGPLITVEYVETILGSDVDETRTEALIEIASDLVRDSVGFDYADDNSPARIKQAVCQLVISALISPGEEGSVKAEQIGDYRVEFARTRDAMDLAIVEELIGPFRRRAYSVTTPVSSDGGMDPWWEDDSVRFEP